MKIIVNIANGYKRSKIAEIVHDNPELSIEDVTAKFVALQYEPWIKANLSAAYSIEDVTADNFKIDFTDPADADVFRQLIGGQVWSEDNG